MTILVFAVIGGLLGIGFLGGSGGGFVGGAVMGALAGWASQLGNRIDKLERQLAASAAAALAAERPAAAGGTPAGAPVPPETRPPVPSLPPRAIPAAAPAAPAAGVETRVGASAEGEPAAPAAPPGADRPGAPPPSAARARAARRAALDELEPSPLEVAFRAVKRWFTTGNVPVKVGVVLSVFGVGFLVKEGIDRRWLVLPLELRLALVAAFGIALLGLGWRLRHRQRTYALSVQGGGIAVLYLTTYASFALYDLLPATVAFLLLVIVTAAAGALAVLQDTRALAVLGIVGGFMAPVLTSTDSGNHVALFGYYAVLNLAILGIAWFKAWRELNVLGFLFTFGIGSLWGYQGYRPEHFSTTEPFLVLFVVLYTLIPVLFASRRRPELRGFVDGTLVFGTPIVGFALQSELVGDTEYGLAISAVVLAAWYIGLATWLHRRRADELRVLVESLFALSVAFLTIAVPLALDARWTSAAWALQGAAMVWLGFRQDRTLALVAGVLLQVLAGAAYSNASAGASGVTAAMPVLNGHLLGAVLIAAAGGFSSRCFDPERSRPGFEAGPMQNPLAASLLLIWASGWWLWAGFVEIDRHVPERFELAAELLFSATTTLAAPFAAARLAWPRLDALGLVSWPIALFGVATALFSVPHPLASLGWLGWPAICAAMFVFLRARESRWPVLGGLAHAIAYWLLALLTGWETAWQVDRVAGGVWPLAAALAVVAGFVAATLDARTRLAWPVEAHLGTYVKVCCGGVVAALLLGTVGANLVSPGTASPLPYVPLFNPLELASVFVAVVLIRWLAVLEEHEPGLAIEPRHRAAAAGVLGWFLLTMMVARAVHHWAGVPFTLASLVESPVLQTSLSIVWGAMALLGMVIGARARQRAVWIAGAALMAVVVAKLFVVELDNTGTLGRVVSFLGVGVLLLVVGYFAPVPPRAREDRAQAEPERSAT